MRLNARDEIRIALTGLEGEWSVSVRVFWTPDRGATWKPTHSRLNVPLHAGPSFLAAFAGALDLARRLGYLPGPGAAQLPRPEIAAGAGLQTSAPASRPPAPRGEP